MPLCLSGVYYNYNYNYDAVSVLLGHLCLAKIALFFRTMTHIKLFSYLVI